MLVDPFGLKGTYVWESSYHEGIKDPQDDLNKFGVQITPLSFYLTKYPGHVDIYVRRKQSKQEYSEAFLDTIHTIVYKKPYDLALLCLWPKGNHTIRAHSACALMATMQSNFQTFKLSNF